MSAPALTVATVAFDDPDDPMLAAYHGLLLDRPGGREVWRCGHPHPKRPGARACAQGELQQRAMPQRKGDWDGRTRRVRDLNDETGWSHVPVCSLCAKGLLHTRAEHTRLEASLMKGAPRHA